MSHILRPITSKNHRSPRHIQISTKRHITCISQKFYYYALYYFYIMGLLHFSYSTGASWLFLLLRLIFFLLFYYCATYLLAYSIKHTDFDTTALKPSCNTNCLTTELKPSRNKIWYEKTRVVRLPHGDKILNILNCFDTTVITAVIYI